MISVKSARGKRISTADPEMTARVGPLEIRGQDFQIRNGFCYEPMTTCPANAPLRLAGTFTGRQGLVRVTVSPGYDPWRDRMVPDLEALRPTSCLGTARRGGGCSTKLPRAHTCSEAGDHLRVLVLKKISAMGARCASTARTLAALRQELGRQRDTHLANTFLEDVGIPSRIGPFPPKQERRIEVNVPPGRLPPGFRV